MNVDPVNELQCRTLLLWSPLQKVNDSPPIETYVKLIVGRMVNGWISQEHDESWSMNGDGGPKINNSLLWSTAENKCY